MRRTVFGGMLVVCVALLGAVVWAEKAADQYPDISIKDLKAIFFVKDFSGNPERRETNALLDGARGRRLEVTFSDGETLIGTTEGYSPQKTGFFMFPADSQSNNSRIFIVNKNVRSVKPL